MMPLTPCECTEAGWCERHRCEKSEIAHQLCRHRADYFQLWEQGIDPFRREATATLPLPRCQHRGDEPVRYVSCQLCGQRTAQIPVYECEIRALCTERRYMHRSLTSRDITACTGCESYVAPDIDGS